MKKRILSILLCFAMIFTTGSIGFAAEGGIATVSTEENGLVIDKSAVYYPESESGVITLSSYLKGEVKSTPTDVALIIDHSGSMWTAVDPENGQLTFSQLDKEKGIREGYYVAFSKEPVNRARLVRYNKANKAWEISKDVTATTYDGSGNFVGFINTIYEEDRNWSSLKETDATNYIFCVSISGALYSALNSFMYEMRNAVDCRVAVATFAGNVQHEKDADGKYTKYNRDKNDSGKLTPEVDYKGSGIFVDGTLTWDGTAQTLPRDKNGGANSYRDAFEDPTTTLGQNILKNTIDAINTDYGNTPTALGLLYARRLFNEGGRSNANKVAIVFTDGIPAPAYLQARGVDSRSADLCDCSVADYTKNFKPEHYTSGRTTNTATGEAITVTNILTNEGDALREELNKTLCDYCDLVRISDDVANKKAQYGLKSTYIDQAHQLKNANKATVYSIGPTAGKAGTDVLRNIASSADHYYNASSDQLNKVFEDIAGVIVQSSQQLNINTELVDTLSQSFVIPDELVKALEGKTDEQKAAILKEKIKVYTAAYAGVDANGKDKFGDKVKFEDAIIELEGKTVKVSNFAYDKNAVFMAGATANGKKLIVEIPFEPRADFLGGDDIPTNTEPSGIYNGEIEVKPFVSPNVDVPVRQVTAKANDTKIYLSQAAELPHIVDIGKFKVDGTEYTIDGINNGYAKIVYTVKADDSNYMSYTVKAGEKMNDLDFDNESKWNKVGNLSVKEVLTKDTEYKITCDVISSNNEANAKAYTDGKAKVEVYKPEVTFKDSLIYLGETADYDKNGADVVWKHGSIEADASMGEAPQLVYTYSPVEGAFQKDTSVKVTKVEAQKAQKTGDMKHEVPANLDITSHATFFRDACTVKENCNAETIKVTDDTNFIVHVKSFDLVIEKEGADLEKDPEQSFIFNVQGPNALNLDVVIVGNGTTTIKNLPVGEYTVTEKKEWSWRYTPEDETLRVDTDGVRGKGEIMTTKFKNSRIKQYWLSGNDYIQNLFKPNAGEN